MSQEDKLKEAKRLYETANSDQRYVLESLFPELKESEDERTRKEIIRFIQMEVEDKTVGNKWLAWLEKQGEQKSQDKSALEPIKEEKVDNATKVESNFKVGDWVVRTNGESFCNGSKYAQIQAIALNGGMCYLDTGSWLYPSKIRLWSIEDAKDGDVLVCPKYAGDIIPNIFIFKDIDINNDVLCYCAFLKIFFATGGYIASADPINTDFYPATKEQCDLLFQKMKESGYEWNADKKELKNLIKHL